MAQNHFEHILSLNESIPEKLDFWEKYDCVTFDPLYKKSEKSLEPFSRNTGITLLLGSLWAIMEKQPCTFLALIVVNFHAKY